MLPRILIIDDHADHVRAMAGGLTGEGFEVETAADLDSALALLNARQFDLALVDLMMPGTNGIRLARLLRDRYPGMRVILTGAYPLSEPQLVRADCGAVGFMSKPFDLTALARSLRAKLSCGSGASRSGAAA